MAGHLGRPALPRQVPFHVIVPMLKSFPAFTFADSGCPTHGFYKPRRVFWLGYIWDIGYFQGGMEFSRKFWGGFFKHRMNTCRYIFGSKNRYQATYQVISGISKASALPTVLPFTETLVVWLRSRSKLRPLSEQREVAVVGSMGDAEYNPFYVCIIGPRCSFVVLTDQYTYYIYI